jgi:hypothetical protein
METDDERNARPAKYWGWPDRGPWTAYRELLLFLGFVFVGLATCALAAFVVGVGWVGFVMCVFSAVIGSMLMIGVVQVIVRPFYERFGDDIGPSEPWLLPNIDDRERQSQQQSRQRM